MSARMESGMVRLKARVPIREDVRKQPLEEENHQLLLLGLTCGPEVWVSCSPKPQELGQNRPDQTVDQDVGPDQLARQLEGLEAGVVQQQETGPEQQQVEQTHEA